MAKGLASKLRTGAMVGLAALAVAAPMKANATTLDYVTTTITDDVDQDLTRDGFQIRYDWTVKNNGEQDWTPDSVWGYTISANLEERQMYGFSNSGNAWSSSANNIQDTYSWLADLANSVPIRPGATRTFSALIDQNLIIGNEQVGSYGVSNEGATNIVDATIPMTIPEPMAVGLFALGGAAALVGRRMKNDYSY